MKSPQDSSTDVDRATVRRRLSRLALVAALSCAACQTTPSAPEGPPPAPDSLGRWTKAFLEPALLIAEEIRIEGPPALRAHLALPQDLVALDSTTRATDDGLLHRFTPRREDGTTARAQIDNWQIVATKRLIVLERPNESDVRIHARGDAAWLPTGEGGGSEPRRSAELVFAGELVR